MDHGLRVGLPLGVGCSRGGQGTHHDHERDVLKKKRMYKKLNYLDPVLPILLLLLERYSVSS